VIFDFISICPTWRGTETTVRFPIKGSPLCAATNQDYLLSPWLSTRETQIGDRRALLCAATRVRFYYEKAPMIHEQSSLIATALCPLRLLHFAFQYTFIH
jgi:hypothetical protein